MTPPRRTAAVAVAALFIVALSACSSGSPSNSADAPAADTQRTVLYEVTSDAPTAGNITYLKVNDGASGQEQVTEAPLPFSKEIPIEDAGLFESSIFSLVAQSGAGSTTITCRITADGEVIQEQTSTGEYAVVTCSGSAK